MASSRDSALTSQVVVLNSVAAGMTGSRSSAIWLWLMGIGYGLALTLLGVAGVLYRRRRTL